MRKSLWMVFLAVSASVMGAEVFHLDFKDGNGKSEFQSGVFTVRSARVPMLVQNGALRLAPVAEVEISGPIPDLRKGFTVSAWIYKKRMNDVCPILSRGGFGDLQQFVFTGGPEFFTRRGRWEITGISTGNKLRSSGEWKQVAGVFSQGEYRVYVDGKLFSSAKGAEAQLPEQDSPLVIGAEKNALARMNYSNANMLLNDLRLYDHPLQEEEIAALYASERNHYPIGSQLPPGTHPYLGLENCFHYDPGDPDMKRELELTRHWKPDAPMAGPLRAEVRHEENSAARLFINDKEHFPYGFYLVKYIFHDRYELQESIEVVRDFGAAGMNICRSAVGSNHVFSGYQWLDDGKYDFSFTDDKLAGILKGNPGAMLDIMLGASSVPAWFSARYPDDEEQLMMPNGTLVRAKPGVGGLLGSDVWKDCTERYFQALYDHIAESPYADRIFCYTIGGGGSSEWYWPGTFAPSGFPGYSKATLESFRAYLKKRGIAGAETAEIPLPEARMTSETLMLRDPQKAEEALRFRRYLNDRSFELMSDMLRLAKKAGGGKRLVGTYVGYSLGNKPKHHYGGMNIFGQVIRLPELDFSQLAMTYGSGRAPGKSGLCVNPYNGSSMLHGKLLLCECDLRTVLYTNESPGQWANRPNSMEEMISVIERDAGLALTRGTGFYEMLLTGLSTYHDEEIMNAVKRNVELTNRSLGQPRASASEVAVVYDENSDNYFAWPNPRNSSFFNQLTIDFYQESPRAGFPADFYTLDDLADPRMRPHKLYIFLNAIAVSPEMRETILRKLDAEKATAVWCFAPGFINNERFDVSSMEALTGIPFDVSLESAKIALKSTPDSPFAQYADNFGEMQIGPVFAPKGEGLTVHATALGRPALVEKKVASHTSFYLLTPPNPEFLRAVARRSGVHIWLDTEDVFSANQRYIHIHASKTGVKTVFLPGKYDVLDAYTGKELFKGVSSFAVTLPLYGNGIYEIRKAMPHQ
ncbi:MAG: hypothetical protein IKP00_13305 [Victivallales bacterium]|nr:hypothetical protein [Victivallales bacterium]